MTTMAPDAHEHEWQERIIPLVQGPLFRYRAECACGARIDGYGPLPGDPRFTAIQQRRGWPSTLHVTPEILAATTPGTYQG